MKRFIFFIIVLFLLFLSSCGGNGGNKTVENQPVISENAVLLDEETTDNIESINTEEKKIIFKSKTSQISEIKVGSIVVIPINDITPDGMLIKVTSIKESSGKVIIEYESASLTELIEDGDIIIPQTELTENNIDRIEIEDESSDITVVPSTSISEQSTTLRFNLKGRYSGSVSVKSALSLGIGYNFIIKIRSFSLNYLKVSSKATEKASVIVTAKAGANAKFKKRIGRILFKPVTVWVGWVPVYIRPVLYFYLGADAKAQAIVKSDVKQSLSYEAGIEYNGGWSPINEYQKNFTFNPPSLKKAEAQAKGFIEPQLVFWVYGVTGPYIGVDGYLLLKANALADPWCDLLAGIQGFAGAKLIIISKKLANVRFNLFDVNQSLYQCKDPYLIVSPEGSLSSYGPEGGEFKPSSIIFTLSSSNNKDLEYEVITDVDWLSITNGTGITSKASPENVEVIVNQNANNLLEGTYTGQIFFKNKTSPDKGDQSREVKLIVRKPTFTVSPYDAILIGNDYEGGSFSNLSQVDYTLGVDIGSVDWEVTEYPTWLTLSAYSGTVSESSPQTVTISVNPSEASSLPVGTKKGLIRFVAKNKKGEIVRESTRTVYIQVKMNVKPLSGKTFDFPEGGTSEQQPQPWIYSIEAINGSINWEAYISEDWLSIDNRGTNITGTVQKGSKKDLSIYQNVQKLQNLDRGTYSTNLEILNLDSGVFEDRALIPITANVTEPFEVNPSTLHFKGIVGNSVTPSSGMFTVSTDFDNVSIQVSADKDWVNISDSSFTVSKNTPHDVNVSLSSDVNNFPEGIYTATVTFTKTNGSKQVEIRRTVNLVLEKKQNAKIIWIGTLAENKTVPEDFSNDGSVVVGWAYDSNGNIHAFRWENGVMQDLGTLGGNESRANGVSAAGNVVVGFAEDSLSRRAFKWEKGTMQDLGNLGDKHYSSYATDVSEDGNVVVGYSGIVDNNIVSNHAFRWENGVMQDLGTLGSVFSYATAVSRDGNTVVGYSYTLNNEKHAFRWENGVMQDLGTLGGSESEALDVSADGNVIVGWSYNLNGKKRAFRWENGVMQDLGTLGGNESEALGVSADGSIVVGWSKDSNGYFKPFIWTAQTGMVDIEEEYTDLLTSCTTSNGEVWYDSLFKLIAVSPDGRYLLGEGNHCSLTQPFIIDRGNAF